VFDNLILRYASAAVTLLLAFPVVAAELTQGERDRALSELHATRKEFLDAVSGLSEAQWNFKPAPNRWSVAECAEHLTLAEEMLFNVVTQKIMHTPAEPRRASEVRGKDELVLSRIPDRTHKAEAPSSVRPAHRWPTPGATVQEFKTRRDRTLAYVRTTNDDLRDHFLSHPAVGLLDGYQWILLIAAHTQRHVEQIHEVKQDPSYPKK